MSALPFIIDGHLDLSMNAMEWNRDLRMPIERIRQLEQKQTDKPDRGNNTVSFSELRKGNIGLCFATLIARYAKPTHPLGGWRSPEQAWGMVQAQFAWYKEMEHQQYLRMITNKTELAEHLKDWTSNERAPIGYLLSLEGADSIISMEHLDRLYEQGLRAIGPAHYGPGTYAYGTDSDGSIGEKGKTLLSKMDALGMVLDVTHLSDTSFWEAMDHFKGTVWASHNNCRALVAHNRQFSNDQIKALIERDAVIGAAFDAWMLVPNWQRQVSHPDNTDVRLKHVINHIDHICQIAGNTKHVALGTDLDGGFGKEQGPADVETIADLQKLENLLAARGYNGEDIAAIFSENWLRKLEQVLQ